MKNKLCILLTLLACFVLSVSPALAQRGERIRALLGAVEAFAPGTASGQPPKPVVIISLASLESFRETISTIEKANQDVSQDVAGKDAVTPSILSRILQWYEWYGRYHVDPSQPSGAIVMADGLRFFPILFSPIRLDAKSERLLPTDFGTKVAEGRYRVNTASMPPMLAPILGELYLQERGKWVFIAPAAYLDMLPADPTPLLAGLDRDHLAAMRVDVTNIPRFATTAALAIGEIASVAQATTDADRAMIRLQNDFLRRLIGQSDAVEAFVTYEEPSNDIVLRVTETTPPKTQRGQVLDRRQKATTTLGSFFKPAGAVSALCVKAELTSFQRQQLSTIVRSTLGNLLETPEEEEKNININTVGRNLMLLYYEGLLAAIESGVVEMAGTFAQPGGLITAYRIQDATKLRAALDDAIGTNTVQHFTVSGRGGDMKLTSLAPQWDSWMPKILLGENEIRIVVGISDELFCLGIGRQDRIEAALVAAIEATRNEPQEIGETFFVYSGYELGQMVASAGDNPNRLWRLKRFAAAADPRATAIGTFVRDGNDAITTFWINCKLVPSLNNIRMQAREARGW